MKTLARGSSNNLFLCPSPSLLNHNTSVEQKGKPVSRIRFNEAFSTIQVPRFSISKTAYGRVGNFLSLEIFQTYQVASSSLSRIHVQRSKMPQTRGKHGVMRAERWITYRLEYIVRVLILNAESTEWTRKGKRKVEDGHDKRSGHLHLPALSLGCADQ